MRNVNHRIYSMVGSNKPPHNIRLQSVDESNEFECVRLVIMINIRIKGSLKRKMLTVDFNQWGMI